MANQIAIYDNYSLGKVYNVLNVWTMLFMALNWNKEDHNVINEQRNDRNTRNQARTKPE